MDFRVKIGEACDQTPDDFEQGFEPLNDAAGGFDETGAQVDDGLDHLGQAIGGGQVDVAKHIAKAVRQIADGALELAPIDLIQGRGQVFGKVLE